MDEWKEILDAVSEHLVELGETGTRELSLPPPQRAGEASRPAQPTAASHAPQASPASSPEGGPSRPEPARAAPPVAPEPQPEPAAHPAAAYSTPVETGGTGAVTATVVESDSLEQVAADLEGCRRCRLHEERRTIVVGEGHPQARLMFIGEGPGEQEDRTGRPFVGQAGDLLTKIIVAMGLERSDVYIANIVKCRPPNNRAPMTDEVETCYSFLRRQIAAVGPEMIVTLGAPSSQALLGVTVPISKLRGNFYRYGDIRVMPTYHPAYLLRNPAEKRAVWDDMQVVMAELKLPNKRGT